MSNQDLNISTELNSDVAGSEFETQTQGKFNLIAILLAILLVSNILLWFAKTSFSDLSQKTSEANVDFKINTAIANSEHKRTMREMCESERKTIDTIHSNETEQGKRLILGEMCNKVLYSSESDTSSTSNRYLLNENCELLDKSGNKLNLGGDDKLLIKAGSTIEGNLNCFVEGNKK